MRLENLVDEERPRPEFRQEGRGRLSEEDQGPLREGRARRKSAKERAGRPRYRLRSHPQGRQLSKVEGGRRRKGEEDWREGDRLRRGHLRLSLQGSPGQLLPLPGAGLVGRDTDVGHRTEGP